MARRIRNSGLGAEVAKSLNTQNFLHRVQARNTITGTFADGTAVARVDTGPYTYQFFQFAVTSKVAIAGKTIPKNGKHYVQTAFLSEFVDRITLEIDGTAERSHTVDDMIMMNGYRKYDVIDGWLFMEFGGPDLFTNERQEDAYMLGTKDLREVRVLFELSNAWDSATMQLKMQSEFVPVARNLAYIETVKSYRYDFSAAGKVTISDLPVHSDLSGILIKADGLRWAELVIDDQTVFEGDVYDLIAANAVYGGDYQALGEHVYFDFWRGKEAQKGLRGLRGGAERKRNADIRLTLDLAQPDTEVRALVMQCGNYKSQG